MTPRRSVTAGRLCPSRSGADSHPAGPTLTVDLAGWLAAVKAGQRWTTVQVAVAVLLGSLSEVAVSRTVAEVGPVPVRLA